MDNITQLIDGVDLTGSGSTTESGGGITGLDVFFFILQGATFLMGFAVLSGLGYLAVFLMNFDKTKGGFQGPPKDTGALMILLSIIYTVSFILLCIVKDASNGHPVNVYWNIGTSLLIAPATLAGLMLVVGIFMGVIIFSGKGLSALTTKLTEASRKKYGYVEPESEQTELEEASQRGETREEAVESEESVALMSLVDDDPQTSKEGV